MPAMLMFAGTQNSWPGTRMACSCNSALLMRVEQLFLLHRGLNLLAQCL